MYYVQFKFDFVELKVRKFQTLHFRQRIKRIILIYHAARRCISLMPQAATNGIEWLHSAFVFIRCTFRCIVHCINSSYSKYSLLKKASETSISCSSFGYFLQRIARIIRIFVAGATMVEGRTIRMAGAAEAQKIRIIRAIRCGKNTSEPLARRSQT